MELTFSYLLKLTKNGLKIAKTKECFNNVDLSYSQSNMSQKSAKIPKNNVFLLLLDSSLPSVSKCPNDLNSKYYHKKF